MRIRQHGTPLFIFTGNFLPYSQVAVGRKVVVQTNADYLLRGACLANRAENGGVDSSNFYEGINLFVASVKGMTSNSRFVLLTYDGYAAHMSLSTFELFV